MTLAAGSDLRGVWYGVLGDTVLALALVQPMQGSGAAVFYRWATASGAGGAVYPVTTDGRQFVLTLPNKSTVTARLTSRDVMAVEWNAASGAQSNFSALSATAVTRREGEFLRAPDDL